VVYGRGNGDLSPPHVLKEEKLRGRGNGNVGGRNAWMQAGEVMGRTAAMWFA